MADLSELQDIFGALRSYHEGRHGNGESLPFVTVLQECGVARTAAYAAIRGQLPTRRGLTKFSAALEMYIVSRHVDLNELLARYRPVSIVGKLALPSILSGAWLVIMYRAKRGKLDEEHPALDYRVGLLVYGRDIEEGRSLQIIGENTLWEGRLTPQDGHYVLIASETTMPNVRETVVLMLHQIVDVNTANIYHHGIATGVGRGDHDQRDFPIFASRVLLWKLKSEPTLTAPLNSKEIGNIRRVCGYFPAPGRPRQAHDAGSSDQLLAERLEAIGVFENLSVVSGNMGDRNRMLIRR